MEDAQRQLLQRLHPKWVRENRAVRDEREVRQRRQVAARAAYAQAVPGAAEESFFSPYTGQWYTPTARTSSQEPIPSAPAFESATPAQKKDILELLRTKSATDYSHHAPPNGGGRARRRRTRKGSRNRRKTRR